jgi:hypothetical protein
MKLEALEAGLREALTERSQCVGAKRFGAAPRHAPARQIEHANLRRLDPTQTQLVGEVRRERDGPAYWDSASSQTVGPLQEEHGRHDHDIRLIACAATKSTPIRPMSW